jgi:outer membrane protein
MSVRIKLNKFLIVFLFCFLSNTSAHCEEYLDMTQCIQIGLTNAYSIKKQENDLLQYQSKIKSAYGALLPIVDIGFAYYPYSKSNQQLVDMPQINSFDSPRYSYSNAQSIGRNANVYIRGTLNVFDGLSNIYRIESSIEKNNAAKHLLKREKERIVYDITKLYYQLMLDQELLTIADENLKLSLKNLEKISAKVKLGDLSISDQYQQEAKASEYRLVCIEKYNTVEIDRVNILNKIGYSDIKESVQFKKIDLPVFTNIVELDKNELVRTAIKNRSDYIGKKYIVDSNKNNIIIARSELFPKVNLLCQFGSTATEAISYSINNKDYDMPKQDNVFNALFNATDVFYGLELKWRVFDGFAANANIQKTKIDYLNSIIEYDELKNSIITEIYLLDSDYRSSISKIKATDSGLIFATQAYSSILTRYDLGFADFTDLAEANAMLVKARSEKVQALYNMDFLIKVISYYTGLYDLQYFNQ